MEDAESETSTALEQNDEYLKNKGCESIVSLNVHAYILRSRLSFHIPTYLPVRR